MDTPSRCQPWCVAAILCGMAINLIPGLPAIHWDLPIYLDTIGTLTVTLLCGWPWGALTGVLSSLLGGLLNPHMPYFIFTHLTIAAVAGCAAQSGGFKNPLRTAVTGVIIGIAAAVVSAPGVALAFAEPDGTRSAFAIFYSSMVAHWRDSFASAQAWIEPVDKILSCTFAAAILALLPKPVLSRFESKGYLRENNFI